eukprot:4474832-Alexandrium_andersonii.AAC.1
MAILPLSPPRSACGPEPSRPREGGLASGGVQCRPAPALSCTSAGRPLQVLPRAGRRGQASGEKCGGKKTGHTAPRTGRTLSLIHI